MKVDYISCMDFIINKCRQLYKYLLLEEKNFYYINIFKIEFFIKFFLIYLGIILNIIIINIF